MLLKLKGWLVSTSPEPGFLEKTLTFIYDIFCFVRVQKTVSSLFGPMYHRSHDLVELDII